MTAGRFNDQKDFKKYFVVPIKKGQKRSATDVLISEGNSRNKELWKIRARFVLQRNKLDVLKDQLLGKDEIIVYCEMTTLQKKVSS